MIDWTAGAGWLVAAGQRLEWRAVGPAQGPVIVLLHEGLGCIALWRDFPEALSQATGLGVFAYSRAGYGQSDPVPLPRPVDYMTREARDSLPMVLEALGDRSVVLFGHSDGGTIAALHAGLAPHASVRALVLMAPHLFAEPIAMAEIARAGELFDGGMRDRMARYHRDPDVAFHGWRDAWLHPDFATWNQREVARDILVPVLALQGRQDQYGSAAQVTLYSDLCPGGARVALLDDCRHAPHQDQPAAVIAETADFIQNCAL